MPKGSSWLPLAHESMSQNVEEAVVHFDQLRAYLFPLHLTRSIADGAQKLAKEH
jgi:hypothetical protein